VDRSVAAAGRVVSGEPFVLQDFDEGWDDRAPAAKDPFGDRLRQPLAGADQLGNKGRIVRQGSFGSHAPLRSGSVAHTTRC